MLRAGGGFVVALRDEPAVAHCGLRKSSRLSTGYALSVASGRSGVL
jgi:hypothetical protein